MIPIDPCGMVMDVVRTAFRCQMDFGGPAGPQEVQWYHCEPDAAFFPGEHRFMSAIWDGAGPNGGGIHLPFIGQGETDSSSYRYNQTEPTDKPSGQGPPCGQLEWFRDGCPPDAPALLRNAEGVALCCGVAPIPPAEIVFPPAGLRAELAEFRPISHITTRAVVPSRAAAVLPAGHVPVRPQAAALRQLARLTVAPPATPLFRTNQFDRRGTPPAVLPVGPQRIVIPPAAAGLSIGTLFTGTAFGTNAGVAFTPGPTTAGSLLILVATVSTGGAAIRPAGWGNANPPHTFGNGYRTYFWQLTSASIDLVTVRYVLSGLRLVVFGLGDKRVHEYRYFRNRTCCRKLHDARRYFWIPNVACE